MWQLEHIEDNLERVWLCERRTEEYGAVSCTSCHKIYTLQQNSIVAVDEVAVLITENTMKGYSMVVM